MVNEALYINLHTIKSSYMCKVTLNYEEIWK